MVPKVEARVVPKGRSHCASDRNPALHREMSPGPEDPTGVDPPCLLYLVDGGVFADEGQGGLIRFEYRHGSPLRVGRSSDTALPSLRPIPPLPKSARFGE